MPRRGVATSTTASPRTRSGDRSPKATASPKAAASPRARAAGSKDVLPSRSSPRGNKRKETEAEVTDGDQTTEKVTTPKRGRPKKTETEPEPETVEETETPVTKTTTRGRGRGRGRGRAAAASTKGRGGKRAKTEETEEAETEETTKAATSEGEADAGAIEKEAEEIVEATTPSKRGRGRGRAATTSTGGRGRGRGRVSATSEVEETESKEKADTAKPSATRGRKRKTDTKTESEETDAQEMTEKKSKTDESESVIMEKGRIYFFYRPKVETARVNDFTDIQRIYILLSPIESQPCQDPEHKHEEAPSGSEHVDRPLPATEEGRVTKQQTRHLSARFPHRLIIVPRKTLPPTTGGRTRVEFAFVEKVSFCIDEIESKLESVSYMTKTRGERHVGGARPVGEGIYELIKHVEVTKPGRKPTSHTQLVYTLEVPDNIGEAQRALNIHKTGNIIIQVGNPANLPSSGRTDREAPHVSHAGHPIPHHLQQLFKGIRTPQLRFIQLDPPELLNYERMQLIMIGDKHGLNEFGEIGEELIAEAEKESEKETEAHHGHPEERIQQEVHLSPKTHPMEPITKGKLV